MSARPLERRREPRFPVNILLQIRAEPTSPGAVGVSKNAGSGGLLIATRGRFEAGEPVKIAFRVHRDGRMRELDAKVVRCEVHRDGEVYPHLVAVRLVRPAPEILSAEPGSPRE